MKPFIMPVPNDFELSLPYYFAGVGCNYEQEDINRPLGHPNYQWIQCRSGRGELILGQTHYLLEEGQGMLLFPNEPHAYHADGQQWMVDWIILKGTESARWIKERLHAQGSGVWSITQPGLIANHMEQLYKAACSADPTKGLQCSAIVYQILLDLLTHLSVGQHSSMISQFQKLTPLLNYIENNYHQPLSLQTLASIAKLSPGYLCTVFKKSTSQSPFEYINRVRIRKSKEILLSAPTIQVRDVGRMVGFEDTSYFCAIFRRFEAMSPMEFRKLYG